MPSAPDRVPAALYVPHGAVPDRRGFAPAIVAWENARHFRSVAPLIISAREDERAAFELVEGIPVHRLAEGRLYRRLFRKATRLDPWPLHRRAAAILRGLPVELVHAHQLEFPVADFLKALKRRIPVLVHAHVTTGAFDPARGIADVYIAASHYVQERLRTKGYPAERIVVVPNGVDTVVFAPPRPDERAALRRKFRIPSEALVLAFAGRKQEVKGFHIFLRTVDRLRAQYKELYAVAAGPEPEDAGREPSYVERQSLRDRLKAAGCLAEYPALAHARLAELFKISDIMLLPSLSEPQGMVMLEALASGCLTISSNTGGIRESIRHGETGFLLDHPEDMESVTEQVRVVLERREALAAMRRAARADVLTRFDWQVVTDRLETLYFKVTGRTPTT
jgi:glycosyltransferase involved in cell wall biosynthesis